ncbi:MAG: hypothetical protein NZ990_10105 [Myxococcota bacterium]|nr:hypothetical protein [Myxococcota bacterium]
MMRRFSRKRRGEGSKKGSEALDAGLWLGRIEEEAGVPVSKLEALADDSVPSRFALLARGQSESGRAALVAFSPRDAGNALLAGLAAGMRLNAEESFDGEVFVVASSWSISARRRLGLVRAELPFELHTVAAPGLHTEKREVEAEADLEPSAVRLEAIGMQLADAADRALFERAAQSLSGLASKHGGVVRGVGQSLELVVLAQRMAELRADDGAVSLHVLGGPRRSTKLAEESLAGAFDDLEGQVRRRLNDKKLRAGEEGLRIRVVEALSRLAELRDVAAWPLGGADRDIVDMVALRADGRPVASAGRKEFDLRALGDFLDGVQKLRLAMPVLFAEARAPVQIQAPELILAGSAFTSAALHAVSALAVAHTLYQIRVGRDQAVSLEAVGAEEATRSKRDAPERSRRQGARGGRRDREEASQTLASEDGAAESPGEEAGGDRTESRRRGRRRGRGRDKPRDGAEGRDVATDSPGFDEVSLFDLEEGETREEGSGGRRRGRSRQRGQRRGEGRREQKPASDTRQAAAAEADVADDAEDPEAFGEDIAEALSEIPDDLPAIQQASAEADYAADDTEEAGEPDDSERRREREKRRAVRKAEVADVPVAVDPPRPPRRRAVIVSAANRDSLITAVLLARDVRLLEGVWVYDQSDLMNFFREVMPDVKEDVPIHMVGFVPSPATDVLQAAALYRDRLTWYDHHSWPPEDVFALKQAIGDEAVHHAPGAGSSLPLVLATSTRRSRFSDKLVDLACGRFSEHDYERWGRLWWWRLGEIAGKSGDVRADIEPLLVGRPSDLAKEAVGAEVPEVPGEVAFVAERDFRIVHFAGYVMVVVKGSEGVDAHLAARVARERYSAQLSLAYTDGSDLVILAGEESGGRRTLDFGALAEHLAEKLDWIESLPDDDHVARFRVVGLEQHPERLDEVVGEIAMGRSILER